MAYCSHCGALHQDGDAYCFQCGQDQNTGKVASSGSDATPTTADPNAPIVPNFFQAIGICFRKFFDFRGRASRTEFWYWWLFNVLIGLGIGFVPFDNSSDVNRYVAIINLVLLLPSTAVFARRLHDLNYSGWWSIVYMTLVSGVSVMSIKYPGANLVEVFDSWFPALYDNPGATAIYAISNAAFLVATVFCLYAALHAGTPGGNKYGPQPIRQK